jgi:hypothetical protein
MTRFLLIERSENILFERLQDLPVRAGTYSDPQSRVLGSPETFPDGLQTVMAAVATARPQPQPAEWQRHIIDGNKEISGNLDIEIPAKPRNGFTGKIHVTLRISQD